MTTPETQPSGELVPARAGPQVGLVAGLAASYVGVAHFSGGAYPTLGLPIGGEQGELRRLTQSFWEDIQFKDFDKAATYHAPELQDSVDIPYLLQRLFVQRPEALEIMTIEITLVDIDSSGDRARVKTRIKARDLAREKVDEREIMLYFKRESTESPWWMELEDSLRKLDVDKEKKH